MPALGERFRAAREARGLALSAVSEQIRIRSVYLAAIEDESWQTIGAPVYVRGFLRTYARFLGLDPEEVVASFNEASQTQPPSRKLEALAVAEESPAAEVRARRRTLGPLLWLAAAVAVCLIAFVVYTEITMSQGAQVAASPGIAPSPTAASTVAAEASELPSSPASGTTQSPLPGASAGLLEPTSTSPAPAVVTSAGPNTIALVLSAPSWLRVTVDGNVSIEGTFPAGTTKLFRGKTARVRIGNAGGVDVIVDGKNLGTLGKSGDVVDRSFAL